MYTIKRYKGSRNWAVYAPDGDLVAVTVYKKGSVEVARRLNGN